MKLFNKHPRGNAAGGFLIILLLLGALAAIYFLVIKKPQEVVQEEEPAKKVVTKKVEEESLEAFDDLPEEDFFAEKKDEPAKVAPKVVEKKAVDPEIVNPEVARNKVLVDRYLAKKFPFKNVTTADEITFGWRHVPKELFPAKVQVHMSRVYKNKSGDKNQYVADGHFATVEKVIDDKLAIRSVDHPELTTVVLMTKTDFQDQIQAAHDATFEAHRHEVLAQREAFRDKAYKILERNKEKRIARKAAAEKERLADLKSGKSLNRSNFDSKKYGKGYHGDYWVEPKNGKNRKDGHEIPMGPICGIADVLYDERKAVVVSLWEDGPGAESGLLEGDVIVKINGKTFPKYENTSYAGGVGFPEALGFAMVEAQDTRKPLLLTVKRGSEEMEIKVQLPYLPAFVKRDLSQQELRSMTKSELASREDCIRGNALSFSAVEYLKSQANDDGALPVNDYTNAWYGLALLSTGDKKHSRDVKKLARYMAGKYSLGKNPSHDKLLFGPHKEKGDGMKAGSWLWHVSCTGMFLAEYYLATGDKAVLPALRDCSRSMEVRMDQSNGRFGHKGGEYPLPYSNKGLVVINVHAHILWALTAHVDGFDKWDWSYWEKSKKQVYAAQTPDHAVGYSDVARGGQQSACRTGAMMTALVLADKEPKKVREMGEWLYENNKNFPDVHAMTFIGTMLGFTGMHNLDKDKYNKVMDEYGWLWSIMQPVSHEHGAYYYSDRHNSGGDGYCNKRLVGNIMALYSLNTYRSNTLWMFGNRKKNWME